MSPAHLKQLAGVCGIVVLAACALAVLSKGVLRAAGQAAPLAACPADEPCNAQYWIDRGDVNAIGGWQASAQYAIDPSRLTAVRGTLAYNMKSIDPSDGGTLVYTDTQGLKTMIEVPPAAVPLCTDLVYTPLLSPTEPLDPGDAYAKHAFLLHAYPCAAMRRLYLPLVGREAPAGILATSPTRAGQSALDRSPSLPLLAPGDPVFQEPVTMTITYSDIDVAGLDEHTLRVIYWTGSTWEDMAGTCGTPPDYVRNVANNVIRFTFCHMSQGALVGN
jgi:hypothetical protein